MTWASGRTTVDELKTLPGTRGVGTLLFGLTCMLAWIAVSAWASSNISPRHLDALLWTGEVLFFWGLAQYLYWGARRIWRQSRTGDRRVPSAGRRAGDLVGQQSMTSRDA